MSDKDDEQFDFDPSNIVSEVYNEEDEKKYKEEEKKKEKKKKQKMK